MFSMIKFTIAFCLSFVLLSIPVQKKPLFYYLNNWAAPITGEIFSQSKSVLIKGVKEGKNFSKKIFNNAKPDLDKISTQSSSIDRVKRATLETLDKESHGEYTDEERSMLSKILQTNE
jgi:hypothetical protein